MELDYQSDKKALILKKDDSLDKKNKLEGDDDIDCNGDDTIDDDDDDDDSTDDEDSGKELEYKMLVSKATL